MVGGLPGKVPLLQSGHPAPEAVELLLQPLHSGGGVGGLGGEKLGDMGVLLQNAGAVGYRPAAGGHLDADALPELLAGEELHQPHLPAPAHVGTAAGAAVRPGPGDDPHIAGEGFFAAVGQGCKDLRRGIGDVHRVVLPDVLVGQGLHLPHILHGEGSVKVDGHQVVANMEAYVVTVIAAAEDAADDVLAAVLLHEVKAAGKVDGPGDGVPHGEGAVTEVEDFPVLLLHMGNGSAAQDAVVGVLATPFRVEGGAVQGDGEAVPLRDAGEDLGGKFHQEGIGVEEFFRHNGAPFCNIILRLYK